MSIVRGVRFYFSHAMSQVAVKVVLEGDAKRWGMGGIVSRMKLVFIYIFPSQ
jgi:hypothetical protein